MMHLDALPDPDMGSSTYLAVHELVTDVATNAARDGEDVEQAVRAELEEIRTQVAEVESLLFGVGPALDTWSLTLSRARDYDDWRAEVYSGGTVRGFADYVAALDEVRG